MPTDTPPLVIGIRHTSMLGMRVGSFGSRVRELSGLPKDSIIHFDVVKTFLLKRVLGLINEKGEKSGFEYEELLL